MQFIRVPANPSQPVTAIDADLADFISRNCIKDNLRGRPFLETITNEDEDLKLWFEEDGYIHDKGNPNPRVNMFYNVTQLLGDVIITSMSMDVDGNPRGLTSDQVSEILTRIQSY